MPNNQEGSKLPDRESWEGVSPRKTCSPSQGPGPADTEGWKMPGGRLAETASNS